MEEVSASRVCARYARGHVPAQPPSRPAAQYVYVIGAAARCTIKRTDGPDEEVAR